jgi:soluble lytic murein transglycosylase-like protein
MARDPAVERMWGVTSVALAVVLIVTATVALAQSPAVRRDGAAAPAARRSAPPPQSPEQPREVPDFVFDPPYAIRASAPAPGRLAPAADLPAGRQNWLALVRRFAQENDVPFDLVDALVSVESDYDPLARGRDDRMGLMQLRPALLRDLSFFGALAEAYQPETNLRLGLTYLSGAWKLSGGKICEALTRYRFGWTQAQALPESEPYCRRVLIRLAANGSPLGADIQLPGLAEARAALRAKPRQEWSEHDKKVKDIDRKFGGDKFGIISD